MKRHFILSVVLTAIFSFATYNSYAQSDKNDKFAVEPLSEKILEKADEIIGLMSTNPDKGNDKYMKLLRHKDAKELTALGRLFLGKNLYPFAKICADQAYKEDGHYLPGLMLAVDVYSKFGNDGLGKAGQKLDEILLLMPGDKEIMYKLAMIYRKVNPMVAKEKLLQIKEIDPSFTRADKNLAEISYEIGDIKEAISYYETYFKEEPNADFDSKCKYAISLYVDKQFEKSLSQVETLLKENSHVLSLVRMKMYNLIDQERYAEAAEATNAFFTEFPDSQRNAFDYWYKGRLLNKTKKYEEAITNFEKSIEMMKANSKNKNIQVYSSLAESYEGLNNYEKAIATFNLFLKEKGSMTNMDYFNLGKKYYFAAAATTDSTDVGKKKNYIHVGDSLFAHVSETAKDSYLGPYWQAKINYLMNPSVPQDTVKYYYEKTLERLADSPNKDIQMICMNYITVYFVQKDDFQTAFDNNEKALAIDPNNATALKYKEALQTLIKK